MLYIITVLKTVKYSFNINQTSFVFLTTVFTTVSIIAVITLELESLKIEVVNYTGGRNVWGG